MRIIKMENLIAKIGIDKFAHLGVGGLMCAMVTFVVLLQEMGNLTPAMIFATPIIGTVMVMFLEFCKEHFLDDEFSWKDVLATFIGCVLVFLSVGVGVLFNVLSN